MRNLKKYGWTAAWLFFPTAVWAQETLTIRILEKLGASGVQIRAENDSSHWTEVTLSRGFVTVNGIPAERPRFGSAEGFRIKTGNFERSFPGQVTVSTAPEKNNTLMFLNFVPLPDYVACVTAAESGYNRAEPEYLKALSAVVWGYAKAHQNRHRTYDLCDLAHCQLYQGLPSQFTFWKNLALTGRNWAMKQKGDRFYFHRCCGGVLETPAEVWGSGIKKSAEPLLDRWQGRDLCAGSQFYNWQRKVRADLLYPLLPPQKHLPPGGALSDLTVVRRTSGGTVKTLEAKVKLPDGTTQDLRMEGGYFLSSAGKTLGWGLFPSQRFYIQVEGTQVEIHGKGLGHGVGLCQEGAMTLAKMGWGREEILNFYFERFKK